MGLFYSPLNAVAEYYAVCGIVRRKCRVAILHAEHHERFCAVVAHTAFCRRVPRAPHCLLCRERPVRQLELSLYAEEEIKFLMLLLGVVITFAALYLNGAKLRTICLLYNRLRKSEWVAKNSLLVNDNKLRWQKK